VDWDLVADIGGTRMRVAQVVRGDIVHRQDFRMRPERSVPATLAEFVHGLSGQPRAVGCAGAGRKIDGAIRLTNGGWPLSQSQLAAATGGQRGLVVKAL